MNFNFTRRSMDSDSKPDSFFIHLAEAVKEGSIPQKYAEILTQFYLGYKKATEDIDASYEPLFITLLDLIKEQSLHPFEFKPYHQRIRSPFDYYQFGQDFVRPLIDLKASSLQGLDHLQQIADAISQGDNVILLANHQTEADPQAISLLLEERFPKLAEEMIFVAGERVITDPLAIPCSMGRNLLCIYSKRYIDHPPEQKEKKQLHNKHTMQLMSQLLSEGGKIIYVAPSGGRDRPSSSGVVEVAPFDPQSVEMFYLMAKRAGHPTHFHPLALKTYELLPPPETIQIELGESRMTKRAPIHIAFGPRIEMEGFEASSSKDKIERRAARAHAIWQMVCHDYNQFF